MARYILAIDQGTTSSRAILYDEKLQPVTVAREEFRQYFPQNGWVEHDPEDLWQTVLRSCRAVMAQAKVAEGEIAGIGITNQRETTLVWEKATGRPLGPAIVWQDRRTAELCRQLRDAGLEPQFQQRTGLILDPYFSGSKLKWMLDEIPGARGRAERGELLFGTVDTYLLWRLTKGRVHATDATNASRTLMFNIHTQSWDEKLLQWLDVPPAMLPEVRDSASAFGDCDAEWFGHSIPVCSMIGDQQGALVGQACLEPGLLKSTYGTGCFAVVNTGAKPVPSQNRLLTTVAYRLGGKTTYALEGSIFMAGAIVQWLRDGLGIIKTAADTEDLAKSVPLDQPELMVPAFTGLGAPYWDPDARAAIFGMTRNTGPKELAAAALQSVALQTEDLLRAMAQDGVVVENMRVDGGMTSNRWFLQVLASITGVPTVTSSTAEATVKGSAMLAALQAGWFSDPHAMAAAWQEEATYHPTLAGSEREQLYARWRTAVARVRSGGS